MGWEASTAVLGTGSSVAVVPVVFRVAGAALEVEVTVPPGASAADLVEALAGGAVSEGTVLLVDGRPVEPDQPAAEAGLVAGCTLELAPPPPFSRPPLPPAVAELHIVGGLDSGRRVPLTPGSYVVGREGEVCLDAPTLSATHARLDVGESGTTRITDLGSTNGTRIDGRFVPAGVPTTITPGALVELGAVHLEIRPSAPERLRPAGAAAGPFNRPPRGPRPPAPPPVPIPEQPADPAPRSRLAWMAMLLPLAMGGVMALVWDPRMALFALFSPVMVLGSWIEDRRRVGRERRAGDERAARARAGVADAVRASCAAERQRRLAALPDVAELAGRVERRATTLWERRPDDEDAFVLRVAAGDERWRPVLSAPPGRALDVDDVVAEHGRVERAPVAVDLRPGRVVGIAGPAQAARAVARGLALQAAAVHGPADLRIAVLTDDARTWSWATWLPHTRATGEGAGLRLLGRAPADAGPVVAALAAMAPSSPRAGDPSARRLGPARLLVVDAPHLTEGRPAPVRSLLAGATGPIAGIVIADDAARLPAMCTTVVLLEGDDGACRVVEPATGAATDAVLAVGVAPDVAAEVARAMAAIEDPEVEEAGASLPASVDLLPLLGLEATPEAVARRWAGRHDRALTATVGLTDEGPLTIDLVGDGPHALLAGTTGAGKSELLRTLVASLAASADPEHLTFVLIDYKGGSAFDACARLPHTVGLVTDLDEHLGRRALRCLEAELRHRERVLRAAKATDLEGYLSRRHDEPLPRLVVVIDEFATLAAELPDFVDALVGIAQRGRSLGVHLVLATQRPAGAVKDNIRANTNLRIALRVQDAADSTDVIGTPAAASIGRRQAGRGFARLGASEVVAFQAALVSGRHRAGSSRVEVRPVLFGPSPTAGGTRAGAGRDDGPSSDPSDLACLVDAIGAAARDRGIAPPRRPWPDPLPRTVRLDDPALGAARGAAGAVVVGLADDPANQAHRPHAWSFADGNLLLYGVPGSGTTTAVHTIARSLAATAAPDRLHLYAVDFGAASLAALDALPHTGAVVLAGERERQLRLLGHLRRELEHRRAAAAAGGEPATTQPRIVTFIDGWSGFQASFDDVVGLEVRDHVARIVADGPALGMSTVITADQPNAVPLAIAALVPQRLVFRLADRRDYASFGIPPTDVPAMPPGRALDPSSGLEVQVALGDGMRPVDGPRTAPVIGVLPTEVTRADLPRSFDGPAPGALVLPIGISDAALAPAGLVLRDGDHALVTGRPRSGRSTTLCTIAAAGLDAGATVVVFAPRPSPARDVPSVLVVDTARGLAGAVRAVRDTDGPALLLVDDAEGVDDAGGELTALLAAPAPAVHVVAAGRADALRSAYGHWTRQLRRSRLGLALRPDTDDGEPFGCLFNRRDLPAPVPGRGFLVVDGQAEVFQVALP